MHVATEDNEMCIDYAVKHDILYESQAMSEGEQ